MSEEKNISLPGLVRQLNYQFDSKDIEASRERIRLRLQEFGVKVDKVATKNAKGSRSGEMILAVTDDEMYFNVYCKKYWVCGSDNFGWSVFFFDNGHMHTIGYDGIRKAIEAEPAFID